MASWMVHLRIADAFLDKILNISPQEFVVGNIGPDCSTKNSEGRFDPPSPVTHWTPNGHKADIDLDGFFYAKVRQPVPMTPERSFYLGYYVHLYTDVLWTRRIFRPTKYRFSTEFYKDAYSFLDKCRVDWYALDHQFVRDNPDFRAFSILNSVDSFPNIYFDYYSPYAFDKQIDYICRFYNCYEGEYQENFKYLTKPEMDNFVVEAVDIIQKDLIERGVKIII